MANRASVSGGDKIVKALRGLAERIAKADHVNVGFLENATYAATTHRPDQGGLPVAQVAYDQEFGGPVSGPLGDFVIPPRPFFRQMIAENMGQWPDMLVNALKASSYDSAAALRMMGAAMVLELQESIRTGEFLPLSPITLMLRKMADEDPNLVLNRRAVEEALRRLARGETGATGDRAKPLQDTKHMLESVDSEVVTP